MKLDILIVGYRAQEEMSNCLASIALFTSPGYRLTVHDNTAENYPLTWIWNRFFEQSGREAIAVLNPDIMVSPGWDSEGMACLEANPQCAAVGPLSNHAAHEPIYRLEGCEIEKIEDTKNHWIERVPGLVADLRQRFPSRFHLSVDHHVNGRCLVSGHCMIVRRSVWEDLGGFDERFPFSQCDDDFNKRVVHRGMTLGISLHSLALHFWGACRRSSWAAGEGEEWSQPKFKQPPPGSTFRSI